MIAVRLGAGLVLSLSAALVFSTRGAGSTFFPNATTKAKANDRFSNYIRQNINNTWVSQLSSETPENFEKSLKIARLPLDHNYDNRSQRPVLNGHYVMVQPTGLNDPRLLLVSKDVAEQMLGLAREQAYMDSPEFLQWVSGNLVILGNGDVNNSSESNHYQQGKEQQRAAAAGWATPYALSIIGERYTSNCPYGTGDGYGDGRAISIAEIHGYEVQLKGAGPTPFCRGADGRAVLRSSIREFLASEAMHMLGVRSTRALSLVVSKTDTVQRPWYKNDDQGENDQPAFVHSTAQRKKLLAQQRNRREDPNILITEPCAITARVASSYIRVGHLDLYARRVANQQQEQGKYNVSTSEWKELIEMVWHACFREFRKEAYDPYIAQNDIAGAAAKFLELSADHLSDMVANWARVGFAQGNFNADNTHVGGQTLDYGPFGWMEEYNPLFAKWTGSGEHYGFANQPSSGFANYKILVESVVPVILAESSNGRKKHEEVLGAFLEQGEKLFQMKLKECFRVKMGLLKDNEAGDYLWEVLEPLMHESRVDWTLFWRQLSYVADKFEADSTDYSGMLQALTGDSEGRSYPFYEPLSTDHSLRYEMWIQQWRGELKSEGRAQIGERMKLVNPKYVLREWMLVDAYSSAADGDESILKELFELIQHPYEEGSMEEQYKYYVRAHTSALTTGGTAFMS